MKRVPQWLIAMFLVWVSAVCTTANAAIEDEVFYFVIPDRFVNGNPANDLGGLTGDRTVTGFDATDRRYYHGGDLAGLKTQLRYLRRMGVTSLWISPPFKNKPVIGETAGYHGYWATDYTQVDPHWGTNQELAEFIDLAHRYKMKVYLDVVVNHTADVIKYEECHLPDGTLRDGLSDCPYRSLEDIQTNPYSPFVPEAEQGIKQPNWLNDPQYYNNQGDSTFAGESSVYGDFFGLDDLDTRNPVVVQGMIDIFKGWISEFNIDGFRVDTIKHVDIELWQQWVPAIRAHAASEGKPDFFIFGENFDGLPANLANFTRNAEFQSVLDFGLYYAVKDAVTDYQGTDRLAWVFSQDDLFTNGETHANKLMNFVSNHDVGRIGHFIDNMNISDEEKLKRAQLAQSMMFYSRGIPVLYYGDEQGFTGDGGDAEAREDMMPSQVPDFNDNNLIGTDATTADNNFDVRHPVFEHIRNLIRSYKGYPSLRRGNQLVRYSENTPGILALSRYDDEKNQEAVVVFNTDTQSRDFTLPAMANRYIKAFPRTSGAQPQVSNGELTVTVPGLSTFVAISAGQIDKSLTIPDVAFSGLSEGQVVSGLVEVNALLSGMDSRDVPLHRVHFSVSVDGAEFQSLGTDTNPDYKVFFETASFADGTQLTFKAEVDNYGEQRNSAQVTVEKGFIRGMRVIFKKPDDWGENTNIYWFNSPPQAGIEWPGVSMTNLIDDWYAFEFDEGVSQANLIFNDGEGNQTDDLFRVGDGCYIDGSWSDTCEVPEPGMTVYFQKPDSWADTINVYWFNAAPQADIGWPGQAMEALGEGWYRFQFDNNVTQATVIFNDGNGNQTEDLLRAGDGCYTDGDWLVDCVPPVQGIKVYFKRPLAWGESVNIYYWDAAPAPGVEWPGTSMMAEGNDWYSYQFPLNVTSANIIFNDGEGNQTENLFRDTDGCYVNGEWQDSCNTAGVEPGMTVYFRRPLDWNVPNLHFWYEGGGSDWPGVEMDALGNDWFSLQLPDGVTAANMVINDKTDGSNGNQTTDLYREGDGCYDLASDTWTDSCATPGFTVYFENTQDWTTPYTYFWQPGPVNAAIAGWPGQPMLDLGENWYSFQFPDGVQYSNLIFNDAGSPQTADLFREGDGCYSPESGWSDTCDVPQPGMTVYFFKPAGWGDNTNIYYWNAEGAPGWPGLPMVSLGEGWYSYTFPQGVTEANIIFNDGAGNQTGDQLNQGAGCYGEYGDNWRKSCIVPTDIDVEITNRAAHWLTADTLAWRVVDSRATEFRLYHSATASITVSEGSISGADSYLTMSESGPLNEQLQRQSPHLADWPSFVLDDTSLANQVLKSQLVVAALDSSGNLLEATRVQIPRVLDELYHYTGDLGVSYQAGVPSVTVWAPTAQSIELVLNDANGNSLSRHSADSVSQGAYTFNGQADWDKRYYTFDIQVYHPLTDTIEQFTVSDPYAVGLSQNGRMAQFLDLAGDQSLMPEGWSGLLKSLPAHQDITLYEGHVRDFSQADTSVPEAHRGKYKAFTYNGENGAALSTGMAHLKGLQQAGLSHFHLLPVFDISSIDEDPAMRVDIQDPFSRLCGFSTAAAVQDRCAEAGDTPIVDVLEALRQNDAATADIQDIVQAMVQRDSFNWGYDPHHFNAPEGSYATATDGATRVLEFREMVKALADIDLNLVMDVVYNHTSASGIFDNSVLDKLVPGYYHRLNPVTGTVENSTCCDNTATEHRMMEKLMVDTLVSWAKYFKIDSFRFDLMGHIPKSSMQASQAALAELTLINDGVDGANIYLYGEGWDFGEVSGNQRFEQATQFNMAGTGIATFNDRLRSAVRGGNFTDSGRAQGWTSGNELFPNGYVTGGGLNDQADRIRIGLAGNLQTYPFVDNSGNVNTGSNYGGVGYTLDPQESVNYVDKHDNESLWDNTQAKLPDSMSADDRVRVHMLSNALINYGQGVPFYQMGTDLLRSKSMDRNSYNSGDWFNRVDFAANDNQFAAGLPPAQDNETRWTTMADILYNGNIAVTSDHIVLANRIFREQLQVRYSSPLLRLATAEDVITRVTFNNTGTSQTPGLIAMTISDGVCAGADLDPNYDGLTVLFNADDNAAEYTLAAAAGSELHPVLASGSDETVKLAVLNGDTFTIPAHTAAVFVKPQNGSQGEFLCNPQSSADNQPGITVYFQKPADWQDVRVYYWDSTPVATSVNWPGEPMTSLGDDWYSYQMPNGVQATNLIFNNNNNGQQTENLYRDSDGCYTFESGWTDTCALPGLRFYFQKPDSWTDNVHIHYWNAGDVPGTNWPGELMTALGEGWFFFQMPEGVRSTNLIFNDAAGGGTGEQTTDLSRSQDGCYSFDAGWTDSCTTP